MHIGQSVLVRLKEISQERSLESATRRLSEEPFIFNIKKRGGLRELLATSPWGSGFKSRVELFQICLLKKTPKKDGD
jgi:hypothetical protein